MLLSPPIGLALILLGLAYPMLEIALLIKVGSLIGFWPTLTIVIGTAILGMRVLQEHGLIVVRRLSEALNSGRTPFLPMIEGGVLFFAGLCLVAPGLITDAVGCVLLVPRIRRAAAVYLHDRVWGLPRGRREEDAGDTPTQSEEMPHQQRDSSSTSNGPIIEGEFERLDERPIDPGRHRR